MFSLVLLRDGREMLLSRLSKRGRRRCDLPRYRLLQLLLLLLLLLLLHLLLLFLWRWLLMALWLLVVMLLRMLMWEEMRGWPLRCLVDRGRRRTVRSAKACPENSTLLFISSLFESSIVER